MVAETNPNHTAMATGAFGDRSGIPGNAFAVYDAARRARAAAQARASRRAAGDRRRRPRAACWPRTSSPPRAARPGAEAITTAGIFGKPKLARLFSSRRAVAAPAYDADYLWTPCEDPGDDTPYCEQRADQPGDPVRGHRRDRDGRGAAHRARGREADGATQAAEPDVRQLPADRLRRPRHRHRPGLRRGDRAWPTASSSASSTQQRELGLWQRTVLFVVSDHSMDTTRARRPRCAQRFRRRAIPDDDYLIVQNGSVDMVYLTDRAAADAPRRSRSCAPRRSRARCPAWADGGRRGALPRCRTRPTAGRRTRSAPCTRAGGSRASAPATCSSPTPRAARSPTRPTR